MQKIGVVIQARMSSRRLPGKVLLKIADKEVLEYILDRYSDFDFIDEVFLATSDDEEDEKLVKFGKRHSVSIFVGSLENVLERFYLCALQFNIDIIVRHTADNLFVDKKLLSEAVEIAKSLDPKKPFIVTSRNNSIPTGMDVEVFSFSALQIAHDNATTQYEKEHVTPYLMNSKLVEKYVIGQEYSKESPSVQPRCTLDSKSDLLLVTNYLNWLCGDSPSIKNCYSWWSTLGVRK
jgi:spore coat polysaccharide biosynthesis protein SpsF